MGPESAALRFGRRVLNASLNVYAALALVYLLVPVSYTHLTLPTILRV